MTNVPGEQDREPEVDADPNYSEPYPLAPEKDRLARDARARDDKLASALDRGYREPAALECIILDDDAFWNSAGMTGDMGMDS